MSVLLCTSCVPLTLALFNIDVLWYHHSGKENVSKYLLSLACGRTPGDKQQSNPNRVQVYLCLIVTMNHECFVCSDLTCDLTLNWRGPDPLFLMQHESQSVNHFPLTYWGSHWVIHRINTGDNSSSSGAPLLWSSSEGGFLNAVPVRFGVKLSHRLKRTQCFEC